MNFKKDKIIKIIHRKKDMVIVIAAFFAVLVFLGIALTNLMSVKITIEDVQNYDELVRNPYEKYENIMKKTKINSLINSEQFIEMKYNSDLIIKKDPEIKISPFEKNY